MAEESWVVTGPQVIEVDDVRSLRVQVVGGRVDVVTHDSPGVRIEVHAVDGRPIEVSLVDGELRVGYSFTLGGWEGFLEKFRNFRDRDRADISLAVPPDLPTRVGTVSAEGLLAGLHATASVSTVSGSLVVDGTRGSLGANTVSGEVVVRDHRGDLTINSVSGELAASGALTRVHANTVSGELALDVTSGASSIDATSVSGDVTVRLPEGEGVHVTAHAVSGRLLVDGREHGAGPFPGHTVDISTGDGRSRVSATSVSGHVTLLRGASAGVL
jgi:Putative adhesin